ncbi:gliding motility protein GldN [Segatella maculosa]|uniref:type IX secretion system ring protein PorN/GldN n=1 Tax=Segatella maculosa TaxID=439703 RepID=UPI0028D0C099|nr:gliding motility protein GldN [Segatella maculosa]
MKKRYVMLLMTGFVLNGMAQSPLRQAEAAAKVKKNNANNLTMRAQLMFPTQEKMGEDVVWRRDVYRELNLNDDANAGLYYPVEPADGRMNLFTLIFKLMMAGPNRGGINVYQYQLDGNERFTDDAKLKPLTFLDDHHIFYERTDRGVHINNSDIPSAEVKGYYLKESSYFDQSTATFHTKVLALCPIMEREDEFGNGATKYPLFWVRYDDIASALAKQTVMTSNVNNAAVMSLDDYFTMNLYKGKIYKTTNMQGKTLAQYCNTDSALNKEQRRIESEIASFEKNIWGDQARKDSLDSISRLDRKQLKAVRAKGQRAATSLRRSRRSTSGSSAPVAGSARVTVRRQRH